VKVYCVQGPTDAPSKAPSLAPVSLAPVAALASVKVYSSSTCSATPLLSTTCAVSSSYCNGLTVATLTGVAVTSCSAGTNGVGLTVDNAGTVSSTTLTSATCTAVPGATGVYIYVTCGASFSPSKAPTSLAPSRSPSYVPTTVAPSYLPTSAMPTAAPTANVTHLTGSLKLLGIDYNALTPAQLSLVRSVSSFFCHITICLYVIPESLRVLSI
jgi:hypothetical protein